MEGVVTVTGWEQWPWEKGHPAGAVASGTGTPHFQNTARQRGTGDNHADRCLAAPPAVPGGDQRAEVTVMLSSGQPAGAQRRAGSGEQAWGDQKDSATCHYSPSVDEGTEAE